MPFPMKNSLVQYARLLLLLLPILAFSGTDKPLFCGGSWDEREAYYPIVNQFELVSPDLHSMLYCPSEPYCDQSSQIPNGNLEDWNIYFNGKLTPDQIEWVIYRAPLDWLRAVKTKTTKDVFLTNTPSLDTNEIARILEKDVSYAFIEYMIIARQAENISSNRSGGEGWYQGEGNSQGLDIKPELMTQTLSLLSAGHSSFIQNRLGYQAVRLAHYLGENKQAIRLFERSMRRGVGNGHAYYLAADQLGGAYFNLNQTEAATQNFLLAFENLPSRRDQIAKSLRYIDWNYVNQHPEILGGDNYQEALSFFKVFYANASPVAEMNKLAQINPNSPYLQLMAARALDEAQHSTFYHRGYWQEEDYDADAKVEVAAGLYAFAKAQYNNPKQQNRNTYALLLGTLGSLPQYPDGTAILKAIPKSDKEYIAAQRLLAVQQALNIRRIDRAGMNRLHLELESNEMLGGHRPTAQLILNQFADLYYKQGNLIVHRIARVDDNYGPVDQSYVSTLSQMGKQYSVNRHRDYTDQEILSQLDAFLNLPNPTAYEKEILNAFQAPPRDYYHDLLGTTYLRDGYLDAALQQFQMVKTPEKFWDKQVRPELFSSSIKEWMNVDFASMSDSFHAYYRELLGPEFVTENKEYYRDNKIQLTTLLLELNKRATIPSNDQASFNYMLGNAWYNMSAEGWMPNNIYYAGNNERNELLNNYWNPDTYTSDSDGLIDRAGQYFSRALETPGTDEVKARALFALARTERCFDTEWNRDLDRYDFELCGRHVEHFEELRKSYSDTDYYQEILRECSWFRE